MTALAKLDALIMKCSAYEDHNRMTAYWRPAFVSLRYELTDLRAALSPAEQGGVACYRVHGSHGPWGWVDGVPSAETLAELKFPIEYAYTTPRAAEAMTGEVWVRAWRNRFIDERTTKYQAEGETYEMARTNAEYDANQFAECFAKALTPGE